MGAVDYRSKLVQAVAWHREDPKPLPESVVIQANGAYMSLSDWLSWLFHRIGKYIHAEKNGTGWAHEGYLHPHSWKWTIPTPRVGSGQGTGWPYFVKSPLIAIDVGNYFWRHDTSPYYTVTGLWEGLNEPYCSEQCSMLLHTRQGVHLFEYIPALMTVKCEYFLEYWKQQSPGASFTNMV